MLSRFLGIAKIQSLDGYEKVMQPLAGLLRDGSGRAGCQIGWQRVGGGFFVPEDAQDIPSVLVVERVGFEIWSGAIDVVVDIQQARGVVGVFFGDRGQAGVFREEGAETVPIAIAGGAGNDGVEGGEDRVEGFYVGWVGGGRLGLCLRDGLRGRLGGGGDGERE